MENRDSKDLPLVHFSHRGRIFTMVGPNAEDHIFKAISNTQSFYEQDLLEYIRYTISDMTLGTLALDVGANIGNHSLYLANFVADTVIAVEPNPKILPLLRMNLTGNASNTLVVGHAVGAFATKGYIVEPPIEISNSGMARVELNAPDGHVGDIEITTIDSILDDYREKNGQVKLLAIKLDIEGMELLALQGAARTLAQLRPELFIEAWNESSLKALEKFLDLFGYARITHWAATPVYHFSSRSRIFMRLRAFAYRLFTKHTLLRRQPHFKALV